MTPKQQSVVTKAVNIVHTDQVTWATLKTAVT